MTAEEQLRLHYHGFSDKQFNEFISRFPGIEIKYAMIEFAKLHVKAALKAASENAKTKESWWQDNNIPNGASYTEVDRQSILKAYPLENIK